MDYRDTNEIVFMKNRHWKRAVTLLADKTVTITYKDIITSNSQDQFSSISVIKCH